MKNKAHTEVFRKMDKRGLIKEISNMKEDLMKVRFQQASSQLTNSAQLNTIRKKIAQAMTVLNQQSN